MEYYDSEESKWKELEDEKDKIQNNLVQLLKSKNLNILSGLGTSLTINDEESVDGEDYIAPKMSDLWKRIEDNVNSFDDIKDEVGHPEDNKDIEALLSRCQQYYNLNKDKDAVETFIKEAEDLILDECDFIDDELSLDSHSQFLRKIAQRSLKLERTKIFTTNYDECFEKAASHNRFHIVDGFSYLQPRTFDASYFDYDLVEKKDETQSLIPQVFHLYKLHGSINWKKNGNGQIIQSIESDLSPCLIYPQSTKYELSYQQPYLEIMSRFQMELRKANMVLIVIGFGFNDDHLVQPIINALRSNVRMKLLIVDPCLKDKMDKDSEDSNEHLLKLKNLVDSNDTRVSFLQAKFDDFVKVIPNIAHESEKERMLDNLRNILG